ncbi:unnamed protein product [Echinostoma caproni]|uniref:THAP-type domain-containing protein n=1 Tax=Echinostoma caproni TaxID=27848 RepID=A0A183AYG2_9TREM|nr:unnamed protein product [Echinostoma caproni]
MPVASETHKYWKRGKRIRAGWQTALGRITPSKMTVPSNESWLNEHVDDSVVQLDNFVCFRQDRQRCWKKLASGLNIYINSNWCSKSEVLLSIHKMR